MDKNVQQPSNNTLHQSAMPERVLLICEGLLRINADFFDIHLNNILNELENVLFKNADSQKLDVKQGEHLSGLRNLKRTRYDFIPRFLAAVEHHIANIRPFENSAALNDNEQNAKLAIEMQLVDHHDTDEEQIQFEITSRCESQYSFDIFQLGQRFGVLAGKPAFEADKLPIGPKIIAQCLQESIQALDLSITDKRNVYYLFERHVFNNFSGLLNLCNQFLIENGILPNLSYVPFRNATLRNKKTPIAIHGTTNTNQAQKSSLANEGADLTNVHILNPEKLDYSNELGHIDPTMVEESFVNLRHLLAQRKLLLNKLSSFSNTYINERTNANNGESKTIGASAEVLGSILSEFQSNAADNPNSRASIQHLKHDLLAQLRNQSTEANELTLKEEDSDAIDLVGMLMDNALKGINPNSVVSQLLSLMQTPLIRVVLQDKSFFSNHVHPARQMLNVIAETGFNWLDENNQDATLHGKISTIVNKTVREYNGDDQELVSAYEETNRILQALIKKAETAERRQVDAASGKERLNLARSRAEKTMNELVESYDIPNSTLNLLNQAWTDVMALTELRQGNDSSDWQEQKSIAESIIAANLPDSALLDPQRSEDLKTKIQESLALIGYHQDEAKSIAESLIDQRPKDGPNPSLIIPERIRFGGNTQSANRHSYHLNEHQIEWMEQIKQIQAGTWFEFIVKDSAVPVRRKLAWKSDTTHNILFVNQRGQKTSEMMIEELAIELSEGTATIQIEHKHSVIEWAFESLLKSLRNLMHGKQDKDHD
jgi:hypothetical protein